jgi:hypothetical protein
MPCGKNFVLWGISLVATNGGNLHVLRQGRYYYVVSNAMNRVDRDLAHDGQQVHVKVHGDWSRWKRLWGPRAFC